MGDLRRGGGLNIFVVEKRGGELKCFQNSGGGGT